MTSNKDYLSQEEIDALLQKGPDEVVENPDHLGIGNQLTEIEQDALGEIANITFGSAATALSSLLGQKVEITTPTVSVIARKDLDNEFPSPHVAISVKYVSGFEGINLLVIKTTDAQVIADLMLGGDGTSPASELTEIHISAVQEAMNQMMGSAATSMSTLFNRFINISPPIADILNMAADEGTTNIPNDETLIKVSFRIAIGQLVDSSIMQLLPLGFAKEMVSILMGGEAVAEHHREAATAENPAFGQQTLAPSPNLSADEAMQALFGNTAPNQGFGGGATGQPGANMQQPNYQQPNYQQPNYQQPTFQQPNQFSFQQQPVYEQPMMPNQPPAGYGNLQNRDVNVQPVRYTNFPSDATVQSDNTNLNLLLDIPLKVTVELGRTQKLIRDILELSQGSIIELDKLAGEPVDILVNNKLIAKGEVVVIDENFGVRITDIVSQWDRMQKLQ